MNPSLLQVRRITSAGDPALAQVAAIYTASIPGSERKPQHWLQSVTARADYSLLAAERDGRVLGLAILFCPGDQPFALLEYFAIAEPHRGSGLGSALLAAVRQQTAGRALLLEVESADGKTDPATADRERRQRFYRRHGCRRVRGLAYQLPLPTNPPPMDLFIADAPAVLQRAELMGWIRRLYSDVYQQAADDPRLAMMQHQLPGVVSFD